MFLVLLTYLKPLSEVDLFVGEHREFLARQYADGVFQLSGRKEPRTGGLVLAKAASREHLDAILRQDPFHREQIADYQVIEFVPTMSAPDLRRLTEG